ncbi:MAG: hypothetical protein JWQ48_4038 [Conexibacter sp.]|nr:hypothetical protein [Conexibacter sp.]
MAEILPLTALHYDLARVGSLQDVVAPPYDVIDDEGRRALAARSPYNVVRVDLPQPAEPGGDPYAEAARTFRRWQEDGIVTRDEQPAIWVLEQTYRGPDGRELRRRGFLGRVRVTDYGPGRIRPHERTHPGPKEDRLRLTRATRANLSPIFSLFSDPGHVAWQALAPHVREQPPFGEATDDDGTVHRLWRVTEPQAIATVLAAVAPAELLIADGHHRYETARVYADEVGGEGPHRYVLMCLVPLEDPGLTVFPTHRLLTGLADDPARQEALAAAIRAAFEVEPLEDPRQLVPDRDDGDDAVRLGYMDARLLRPYRLTLKDQAIADAALAEHAPPYRRLDTAVLEALILEGALGMTDEQIDHRAGLDYARDFDQALEALRTGAADAAFFMGATPVKRVQEVAEAGETMPPKSTYFFPKLLTGMLFNPLQ